MKSEVVITEGKARIVLTPESEFERDLIEKVVDSKEVYEVNTSISTVYKFSEHSKHKIEINLNK
jgi:hypothetical protein